MDCPYYDCKYMRYGKDVEQSIRNVLGFYVCLAEPPYAIILNDSSREILCHVGCPKWEIR